jgi:stress response protein SCP2
MSISLQKGQKVNLSKENAGLSRVMVGLGWDEVERKRGFFAPKPQPIDCDASAILLKNGKLAGKQEQARVMMNR